jgi:hypothetical protein
VDFEQPDQPTAKANQAPKFDRGSAGRTSNQNRSKEPKRENVQDPGNLLEF